MATFELYRDSSDKYRWRLRAENGNIVADGSQGYANRRDAERGIEIVKEEAPGADVDDQIEDRRGG
jgi:hypothetical protein